MNKSFAAAIIIEDDPWMREVLEVAVRRCGLKAVGVASGEDAIYAIDDTAPKIILADVLLLHTTIFTLLNELQSHQDLAQLPVILCSGISERLPDDVCRRYGIVEVLDKATMTPNGIMAAIKRHLHAEVIA
ncbi:response regulator [Candidatus Saccharibacteria bacterium]|nr:response regulator [Candidatus Saccharibacteria bacterium]